jgi:opacity protein-like surface antigen
MRRFLLAAVMCGMTAGAQAADLSDLPILRGGLTEGMGGRVDWSGVYVGGTVSRGAADMDYTNSTKDLLTKLVNNSAADTLFNVSNWPLLGTAHASSTAFGAFAGYNMQWTDALIGIELNYSHGAFLTSSTGSQTRTSTDSSTPPVTTTVTASSNASMRVTDFGSLRVRGGYAVGSFLPYGFVGVGLGQADINRSVRLDVTYTAAGVTNPAPGFPLIVSNNANSHLITGFAAGLGFDWMLCAGLFMRAEWEYLRFTSTVDTSVNTARLGLGYKF